MVPSVHDARAQDRHPRALVSLELAHPLLLHQLDASVGIPLGRILLERRRFIDDLARRNAQVVEAARSC